MSCIITLFSYSELILELFILLSGLIETGGWFDGSKPFIKADRSRGDSDIYAPKYILEREEEFKYLLDLPN